MAINPLDPIAHRTAVARSEGQGRRPIFRDANMPSGDARPENLRRRRSLALERSEHDGRLAESVETSYRAIMNAIIALPVALAIIVSLPRMASADPPSSERFAYALAVPDPRDPYAGFITEAARRFAIPERWIRAVMHAESSDDPGAISPKGATGLMQIMPATWEELRARHHLGADIFEPRDNILAGAAYLAELHDLYGSPGFLAAYNAGPARYEKHLVTGNPLPRETIEYMAKLVPMIDTEAVPVLSIAARSRRDEWADAPLFFAQTMDAEKAHKSGTDGHPKASENTAAIVDLSALAPASEGIFVRGGTDEERQP
ncbi:lytic transglycosylase domain-containing protein [Rhizobium sp. YTUHZ044]|uniref:lytic transglycosylase domain-containing protein n=1 Tax=Rhizobium sp. YTUHZ044 TaxID=2962678 RepID=UPI003DA8CF9F